MDLLFASAYQSSERVAPLVESQICVDGKALAMQGFHCI